MSQINKEFLLFYRVLLAVLVILFFGLLFLKNLVPEGKMFLNKNFCEKSNLSQISTHQKEFTQ